MTAASSNYVPTCTYQNSHEQMWADSVHRHTHVLLRCVYPHFWKDFTEFEFFPLQVAYSKPSHNKTDNNFVI